MGMPVQGDGVAHQNNLPYERSSNFNKKTLWEYIFDFKYLFKEINGFKSFIHYIDMIYQ